MSRQVKILGRGGIFYVLYYPCRVLFSHPVAPEHPERGADGGRLELAEAADHIPQAGRQEPRRDMRYSGPPPQLRGHSGYGNAETEHPGPSGKEHAWPGQAVRGTPSFALGLCPMSDATSKTGFHKAVRKLMRPLVRMAI